MWKSKNFSATKILREINYIVFDRFDIGEFFQYLELTLTKIRTFEIGQNGNL